MSGHKSVTIKFTENFVANLDVIEAFWAEADYPQGHDRLLDEIGGTIIPNLERFPDMGRPFLNQSPDSVEAFSKQEKLRARLALLAKDGDIREYVMSDYLLLYAVIKDVVYMLSIRHHKQLSFDFERLWLNRI